MKNKFLAAAVEIIGFNLLTLFLVYKLYILPRMAAVSDGGPVENGLLIFVGLYLVGMIVIGFHIYITMIKPATMAQEELKKAAEESKKAEMIRKEFVANVSHELKTPLTSIFGFIDTLQQGAAEDPEIRTKFIDIIAIETARLKRLIEDLLVLSDIENRKESADAKEFCVKTVLERTVEALEPIAEDKAVRLITEYDETAQIYGSPDRFRQMMVNLIENAIKYSEQGGRVWVTVRRIDGRVQVVVRDEGIGIAEEHLERLFERFYRVDKSRSTKAGGTGLGLSIVKHIAALFGAELKVESKVREGSTFYVTFER